MELLKETCVFAGSFDPVTLGHMYIIGMAVMTFKNVIVAVGVSDTKKATFTATERVEMLKKACAKYDTVSVVSYTGLTADFLREQGVKYLVRGVRDDKDLEYEQLVYKNVTAKNPDVEIVIFNCPKELKKVSSTLVKDCIFNGKPYYNYVPYEIISTLEESSKSKKK